MEIVEAMNASDFCSRSAAADADKGEGAAPSEPLPAMRALLFRSDAAAGSGEPSGENIRLELLRLSVSRLRGWRDFLRCSRVLCTRKRVASTAKDAETNLRALLELESCCLIVSAICTTDAGSDCADARLITRRSS